VNRVAGLHGPRRPKLLASHAMNSRIARVGGRGNTFSGSHLSGLTGAGSLVCSRAPVTEWFLAQRESGYRLAGYELD